MLATKANNLLVDFNLLPCAPTEERYSTVKSDEEPKLHAIFYWSQCACNPSRGNFLTSVSRIDLPSCVEKCMTSFVRVVLMTDRFWKSTSLCCTSVADNPKQTHRLNTCTSQRCCPSREQISTSFTLPEESVLLVTFNRRGVVVSGL